MSAGGPIDGYRHPEGEIELNAGRPVTELEVANTGDRPIQVGSHYHFAEANRALRFDRHLAYGKRPDIPAGTALRFEPGQRRMVRLVPFAGRRILTSGHGLVDGPLDEPWAFERFEARLRERGFDPGPLPPE